MESPPTRPVTPAVTPPSLSRFIRASRIARGLSIAGLAEAAGTTRPFLSMVEAGKRRPDDALVIRLARCLDVDPRRALVLAIRDRLPPELQDAAPAEGDFSTFDAARLHMMKRFDYEVPRLTVTMSANRQGDVRIVRLFEGLRPIPGGSPLRLLRFAERAGTRDRPRAPKLREIETPDGLTYHVHSERQDDLVHRHRIEFPSGWSLKSADTSEGFTFEIETARKKALSLDGELGAFTHLATHPVWRLRLVLEFGPGGPLPQSWLPAAGWLGGGPFDEETPNAIDSLCRKWTMSRTARGAVLEVEEPLLQSTFALAWRTTETSDWEVT